MKESKKEKLKRLFKSCERRCEFAQYGTHILINKSWVRFYMLTKKGIIVLREIDGIEYPEFIKYNKLDNMMLTLISDYWLRRLFKERFIL